MLELLRSEVEVRGLAHITSGGLGNLLRLAAEVGYEIDDPLPVPPIFELIQERGGVSDEEMHEVFNMGCGFCVVVAAGDEDGTRGLRDYRLRRHGGPAMAERRDPGRSGIPKDHPYDLSSRWTLALPAR